VWRCCWPGPDVADLVFIMYPICVSCCLSNPLLETRAQHIYLVLYLTVVVWEDASKGVSRVSSLSGRSRTSSSLIPRVV
jgi:hypothetical protein